MLKPLNEAARELKIPLTMLDRIRKNHSKALHLFSFEFSKKYNRNLWHVECPEIKEYMDSIPFYLDKLNPEKQIIFGIDSPRPPRNIEDYRDFLRKNYTAQYEESYAR